MMRRAVLLLVLALLVPAPSAIGDIRTPEPTQLAVAISPPDFDHVVVLVMENKEYGQIIGSREAPYLNRLAKREGLATHFYGVRHPSLPNYLALLGGSTFGIHTDCTTCKVRGRNLVDQLEEAGISWKGYMGAMPHACYRGAYAGRYAKKHDPFMYFTDIANDRSRCRLVQPIDHLLDDLRSDRLPRFALVSPDLCKDMHDCSVRTGDRYLSHLVPKILDGLGADGVLFLTFDEGSSSEGCCTNASGGHIATIFAGPAVAAAPMRRSTPFTLYSILRTVEEAWGLPLLRQAGCGCTEAMTSFFLPPAATAATG
jgi:phosphatidylinositol-3-phosphatase